MNKDVDSIKKINSEELKKSRNVLLKYIGEQDKTRKNLLSKDSQKKLISKVDGVLSKEEKEKMKTELKRQEKIIEKEKQKKLQEEKALNERAEKERIKEAIEKQRDARKKILDEENKRHQEEKEVIERKKEEIEKAQKTRILEEKLKNEEDKKIKKEKQARKKEREKREEERIKEELKKREREEEEKRLKKREDLKLGKIKLKVGIARQKQLAKEQLEREKKEKTEIEVGIKIEAMKKKTKDRRRNKNRRIRKLKALKLNIKNWVTTTLFYGIRFLYKAKKFFFKFLIMILIIFIFLYFILFSLLIIFKIDNKCLRKINDYIFIPAIVSNVGSVDFYDYIDYVKEYDNQYSQFASEVMDNKMIKDLIIKEFTEKYFLTKISQKPLEQILNSNFLMDEDYNQIGIARINDMRKKMQLGQTIDEVKKYADSSSYGDYLNENDILERFGRVALGLEVNQISEVIIKDNGYYILFKYGQRENSSGLRFIFVKGLSFNEYIDNQIRNAKIFSLVK